MEDNSTNRLTEAELRSAGASDLFVSYYRAAPPQASARREVETGAFDLEQLSDDPSVGGHFFEALWTGDEVGALRRADARNAAVLEEVTGKTREDTFK